MRRIPQERRLCVDPKAGCLTTCSPEIGRPVSQYAGLSRVAPGVPAPSLMHRRRVLDKSITYVGLDVHKDTIAVALAEAGAHKDVREYGKVANTATALNALAAKLSRGGSELRFCYEAGPCGYGIQRQLSLAGHGCVVVAPSLIPRKPGDRIKTDRRDAINLAKLHRAGELTAVWVPDPAHEADPRSRTRASCGRPQSAPGPSAALWLSPASWPSLQSAGVDFDASSLDGRTEIRAAGASHRAGRLHRRSRGGDGAARSSGSSYRGGAAGLGAGPGGGRPASAARDGSGRRGDGNRRTRRHHPLRQSSPADGVSRSGSVRALQRRHKTTRRHHESREWRGPANADRGGLELSVPGPHQPGATAAPGESGKADPRHRVEGAGKAMSALSQARPGRKITHCRHERDRSRTGGLCLGDRQARSDRRCLMR